MSGQPFYDRVFETSTTIGLVAYVMGGAQAGFKSVASTFGDGGVGYFCATDDTDFEVFRGTYTAASSTLSRDVVYQSTNGGSAVNWGAGTRNVFTVAPGAIYAGFFDPGFRPHAETIPALTVRVEAGKLFDGTTLTTVVAASSAAIVAPVGNPRIDRVVIDRVTGVLAVVAGVAAGAPVAPAIPAGKLPVCRILLQTNSTVITDGMITDERTLGLAAAYSFSGGTLTAALIMSGKPIIEAAFVPVAGAATTDLGAIDSNNITIGGASVAITSFGVPAVAGVHRKLLYFNVAGTVVSNNANIVMPGGPRTTAVGDTAMVVWNGAAWLCFYEPISGQALAPLFDLPRVLVQYRVASGTAGPGLTSTAWTDLGLTTTIINTIPGATVSSPNVNLPPGTYDVTAWACFVLGSGGQTSKLRLFNTSGGAVQVNPGGGNVVGVNGQGVAGAGGSFFMELRDRFVLGGANNVKLQQWASGAGATTGAAASSGEQELYIEIEYVKVA